MQRRCDAYLEAQRDGRWDKGIEDFRNVDNSELRVGVMGLGERQPCLSELLSVVACALPSSCWDEQGSATTTAAGLACGGGL